MDFSQSRHFWVIWLFGRLDILKLLCCGITSSEVFQTFPSKRTFEYEPCAFPFSPELLCPRCPRTHHSVLVTKASVKGATNVLQLKIWLLLLSLMLLYWYIDDSTWFSIGGFSVPRRVDAQAMPLSRYCTVFCAIWGWSLEIQTYCAAKNICTALDDVNSEYLSGFDLDSYKDSWLCHLWKP